MKLPFSYEQFLGTLRQYNEAIWPLQLLFYLLAILSVFLLFKNVKSGNKIMTGILCFFWIWMGSVYHFTYFTSINKAAYVFGSLFILQSFMLFTYGIFNNKLSFSFCHGVYSITGLLYIIFALIIYPLAGYIFGHKYPGAPTFGLPCPTTIFTFGIFLATKEKIPFWLLIIPLAWSFIGFTASYKLGIWEDSSLLIAGPLATVLLLKKSSKQFALLGNSKAAAL